MPGYSLGHLENHVLLRDFATIVATDRTTTARMLAHIAEVDARRLYADEGFSSMFDYCVKVHGFTEDMAGMRIRAARMARRFPGIFEAIAAGRLTVTAVCLISRPSKGLSRAAALDLIASAENKTKHEIRLMLAERFPQPDLAPRVRALPAQPTKCVLSPHVPERVGVQELSGEPQAPESQRPAVATVLVAPPEPRPAQAMPLSPGRFGLQLTMSEETHALWRKVEELLAPEVPRGDYAQRLHLALEALIEKREKRRFGRTDSPRQARPSKNDDHVPAAVKRTVYARDGGQCTFESGAGRRCEGTSDLEYDHIVPKARGGKSTVDNLRLRCFAHNQLEAERAFGAGFMQAKRETRSTSARAGSPEAGRPARVALEDSAPPPA